MHIKGGWTATGFKINGGSARTVMLIGLDFNTHDHVVENYFNQLGVKVTTREPKFGRFKEGPWAGKVNGDRIYAVDISDMSEPLGTFHWISNQKVQIIYRGNTQTCGRCHKTADICPGRAYAKKCDAPRLAVSEHSRSLIRRHKQGLERRERNRRTQEEMEKNHSESQGETLGEEESKQQEQALLHQLSKVQLKIRDTIDKNEGEAVENVRETDDLQHEFRIPEVQIEEEKQTPAAENGMNITKILEGLTHSIHPIR